MRSRPEENANESSESTESSSTWSSALKNAAITPWSHFIKPILLPGIISTGRLLSSGGAGLFTLKKSYEILTEKDSKDSNLIYWLSLLFIFCSLVVQLATRVPSIFTQFRNKPHVREPKDIPLRTKDIEDPSSGEGEVLEEISTTSNQNKLGFIGGSVYLTLTILTWGSAFMTAPNNYLSGDSLANFGLNEMDKDPESTDWKIKVMFFAAAIALTAFANYLIFNVKKGQKNARNVAKNIHDKNIPFDKAMIATAGLSIAGSITVPSSALFSTENALITILKPTDFLIKDKLIEGLSFFSAITALVSQITTQPADVYRFISNPDQRSATDDLIKPAWVGPLSALVYMCGLYSDFFVWGLSNYTGVKHTFGTRFKFDTDTYAFIAINFSLSLIAAFLYYCFSVIGGWRDTLKNTLNKRPPSGAQAPLLANEDNRDNELQSISRQMTSTQQPTERGSVPFLDKDEKSNLETYALATDTGQTFFGADEQAAARKLSTRGDEKPSSRSSRKNSYAYDEYPTLFAEARNNSKSSHHSDALQHGYKFVDLHP